MSWSNAKNRRGSIMVLMAISLVAVLSILAIAFDGGTLSDKRRSVQAAADAAALAAATDLWSHYITNAGLDPSGTAAASAVSTAGANGYPNSGASTVTVHIAPTSGDFVGKAGYAEVIITLKQPRGFSSLWGSDSLRVTAKAVAGGTPGNVGILMLNLHLTVAAQIGDNVNILNGGAIFINSDATGANGPGGHGAQSIWLETGAHVTSGGIYTVAPGLLGQSAGSTITYTNGGSLHTNFSPMGDPLASVPEPVVPIGNAISATYITSQTIQPGKYNNITINANVHVTMAAGIYYVSGGSIKMKAGATLTGNGVMFYDMPNNYFDTKNMPSTASVNLTPPTSGIYQGISVFEPRAMSNEIHIITDGSITMSGSLYAQGGEFDIRPQLPVGTPGFLSGTVYNFGGYICDQAEWGPPGDPFGTLNLNPSTSAPTKRPLLVQ